MSFYEENANTQNEEYEGALSWESEISKESSFEVFPDGVYKYTVTNLEKDEFPGSEKMEACPIAHLTIKVENEGGNSGEIKAGLFLHTKTEWKLSEFFISNGQKKEGKPFRPDWNNVIGLTGYCELEKTSFVSKKNGKTYENNQVKKWLAPDDVDGLQDAEQKSSYQAGKF